MFTPHKSASYVSPEKKQLFRKRKSNQVNGKETRTKSVAVLEKNTSQVLAKRYQKGC